MQKFNINTSTLQKHLFNTIQVEDTVQPKRKAYETVSHLNKAIIKKPQVSILMCPQQKKSLQKILIMPLMDVKHYKEILDQTQLNLKQERLQFTTQYMQQIPPNNHKKYFRQSFYTNNKHQQIDSCKMDYPITRSIDLKKQSSTNEKMAQMITKSPPLLQLKTHKKSKSFICPVKCKKDSILSTIQNPQRKGKTSGIQRMLSRYQNLQLQRDESGWQWMSRWLIGRRLINQKKHS